MFYRIICAKNDGSGSAYVAALKAVFPVTMPESSIFAGKNGYRVTDPNGEKRTVRGGEIVEDPAIVNHFTSNCYRALLTQDQVAAYYSFE